MHAWHSAICAAAVDYFRSRRRRRNTPTQPCCDVEGLKHYRCKRVGQALADFTVMALRIQVILVIGGKLVDCKFQTCIHGKGFFFFFFLNVPALRYFSWHSLPRHIESNPQDRYRWLNEISKVFFQIFCMRSTWAGGNGAKKTSCPLCGFLQASSVEFGGAATKLATKLVFRHYLGHWRIQCLQQCPKENVMISG